MGEDTTIRVNKSTWRRLTNRKEPGVSYDEIINELIDEVEDDDSVGEIHADA